MLSLTQGAVYELSWLLLLPCRIYSNLTLNELMLYIIRGVNLPTPSGTKSMFESSKQAQLLGFWFVFTSTHISAFRCLSQWSGCQREVWVSFPQYGTILSHSFTGLCKYLSVYILMCFNPFISVCVGRASEGQNQHSEEHQQSRV